MSPSPLTARDEAAVNDYKNGWRHIMQMVRSGVSWSGRERNCVFLNTLSDSKAEQRFANVSSVSGLGFADDARGLAIVDWDHDGDLDLWFRNRSAPRLRLMQNSSRTAAANDQRRFVAVKLEGTKANRDAIGAVAWVTTRRSDGQQNRVLQSVQAGDGFISQSSKWLHFGLGSEPIDGQLTVLWPGGKTEVFSGLQADKHWIARQGTGKLSAWKRTESVALQAEPNEPLEPTAAARIVLPAKFPLPKIDWLTEKGEATDSPIRSQGPTLVMFWSKNCANCERELQLFDANSETLKNANLDVVAICVDTLLPGEAEQSAAAHGSTQILQDRWNFRTTEATMQRFRNLEQSLFDMYPPPVVPQLFLVDEQQHIISMYRGAFQMDVFLADVKLNGIPLEQRRNEAVPVAGRWFTQPASESEFIELVAKKVYGKDLPESLRYFEAAAARELNEQRRGRLHGQLLQAYVKLAAEPQALATSETYFERALQLSTNKTKPNVHHEFGLFYARAGDYDKAVLQLEAALKLRPDYPSAHQNLRIVNQRRQQK